MLLFLSLLLFMLLLVLLLLRTHRGRSRISPTINNVHGPEPGDRPDAHVNSRETPAVPLSTSGGHNLVSGHVPRGPDNLVSRREWRQNSSFLQRAIPGCHGTALYSTRPGEPTARSRVTLRDPR